MLRLHAFHPPFGVLTFYAASQESGHDGDVLQEGRARDMSSNRRTGRQSISRSHAVSEEILKLNPRCEVTEDRTPESLDVPSTSPLPCELVRLRRKRLPIAR